jgi:hypothetical protein
MSVAAVPLPDRQLIESLFRAVKHVFETNLVRRTAMVSVLSVDKLAADLRADSSGLTFSAVKCSGGVECTIAIITPAGLNFVFARDFLDVDDSLLQLGAELPVYRDAAGEINNMVAGTFRNMLSKTKLHCSLTPPFILDGYAPLLSSLAKAHTAVIAAFNVEEFVTTVCLWT